jgi:hypothetical protein
MLPILLSQNTPITQILLILGIKFLIGLTAGFAIDFFYRNTKKEHSTYEICEHEHCGCNHKENLFKSSAIHTIKTIIFLFIATIIINIIFEYGGEELLSKLFMKDSFPWKDERDKIVESFVKEIFNTKVPVPSEMYDDFEELIKPLQEEHEKKLAKQNND